MYDTSSTLAQFLTATAGRQPTPGGGSVAALAGALAAAIGEMVFNYSIGKKDLAQHQRAFSEAANELERARALLLDLMVEDQAAFDTFSAIKKLPKDSTERSTQLPVAVLNCIRVPQAIGATAVAILGVCDRSTKIVNHYLLSDLAVAAELAMATVRSAVYNCRVNLPELNNAADRSSVEATTSQLLSHAVENIQRIIPNIWTRYDEMSKTS